ncbi:hypothetical protein GYH30_019577 [Glycine max]|uniref:Uncharacterized protein n=1 Tax=Glycine max TaxID=3847 RepID=A0A0R0JFH1_SOYBN|nr:hypothetical protein JHK87_019722 [Glycine soja]KAH1088603.1 hypothetical protein GYH30_019577 [Glycine max]
MLRTEEGCCRWKHEFKRKEKKSTTIDLLVVPISTIHFSCQNRIEIARLSKGNENGNPQKPLQFRDQRSTICLQLVKAFIAGHPL